MSLLDDAARPRPTVSVPWRVNDVVVVYLANLAGATCLALAWWGASGVGRFGDQLAWVELGIGGLVVAGTGNALWLLHGRGTVGRRRRDLLHTFELPTESSGVGGDEPGAAEPVPAAAAAARDQLVAAAGMTRYHRPECQLVAGKAALPASRSAHERAARIPCGICLP